MSASDEVIVAGGGAAGLASAAMLQRRGIPALVLERTDQLGASWRSRYDSLILNTPRLTSTLPGYRMPRRYGRWPSRDDVVEYLEEYARRLQIKIRFGVELERVAREDGGWSLSTSEGEMRASEVVIATGHDREPLIPDWPGRNGFTGELLHGASYRNPAPFRGKASSSSPPTTAARRSPTRWPAMARAESGLRPAHPRAYFRESGHEACHSTTPPACSISCRSGPPTRLPSSPSG